MVCPMRVNPPGRDLVHALTWARLVAQQVALQGRNLYDSCQYSQARCASEDRLTLSSSSGIASANRLARSEISSSERRGTERPALLRLDSASPSTEGVSSSGFADVLGEDADEGVGALLGEVFAGKKHLKMPSACHLLACLKFTQTSMRPGRLNAGSRRSM